MTAKQRLVQKIGGETRELSIEEHGVRLLLSRGHLLGQQGLDTTRYLVRYEEMLDEPIEFVLPSEMSSGPGYLLAGFTFFMAAMAVDTFGDGEAWLPIALLCAVFGVAATVYVLLLRLPRAAVYQLSGTDSALLVAKHSPSPAEADAFVEAVLEGRRAYLRAQYGVGVTRIDKVSRLERLHALLDAKAITRAEYLKLKEEVLSAGIPNVSEQASAGNYV